MKKLFITLIALMAVSTATMASTRNDSTRYLSSKFGQNWFISIEGNVNWWQGSDRNPYGNYTAVQWGKPSYGGSVNLGKWIDHKFGLRLSYDVNQGKSYIDGLHADRPFMNFLFDGVFTYDPNYEETGLYTYTGGSDPDANGYYNTSFMYHNLHMDFLLSPIDIIQEYYNPKRVYTPVLYVGMGAAAISEKILISPDLVNNYITNKDNFELQKGVNMEFSFAAGLINNFRLSNHFDLHLDLKVALQRWNIDSWFYETGGRYSYDGAVSTTEIRPRLTDNNYSVGLGLTYYFSRIYELPNNCCEEMEEFKRRLEEAQSGIGFVPDTVYDIVHDTVTIYDHIQTEDILSYPFSIFFNRDSYQLMSTRDLVNLREIANVAKEKGYKIRLRGSCDSATATPAYNQTLSENRCRKIMIELMDMGIPESQIVLLPVGGVKELNPTEYDRRVLVELLKEAPK